jgi:hypothetical protein
MPREEHIQSALPVRRYTYDSESLIVADLGTAEGDATVEVLEDVILVVLDRSDGEKQFEIDRPSEGVANTFINNGILTIEVNEE